LTTEADGRSVRFVTSMRDVSRRPVVDEIAADTASGNHSETDRGDGERGKQNDAGTLHRDFL
jgi:hypothetical protein